MQDRANELEKPSEMKENHQEPQQAFNYIDYANIYVATTGKPNPRHVKIKLFGLTDQEKVSRLTAISKFDKEEIEKFRKDPSKLRTRK